MTYEIPLQVGDIALVKGTHWISRTIAWSFHVDSELPWRINHLPSNHTGIVAMSNDNELGVWEQHSTFHWTSFTDYWRRVASGDCEVIFARVKGGLSPTEKFRVENGCYEADGIRYDYLSYISHVWRTMLRLPKISVIECDSQYYCTEAVFEILKNAEVVDLFRGNGLPTPYTVEKRIKQGFLEIVEHLHV